MPREVEKLLSWYRTHKRELPWRKTRDPYRIFVSEIMLQQTQVDRVIPKYRQWLRQFPSWRALANAATSSLIHAWAGLGYNRRALHLRNAARYVVAHGEPRSEDAWRKLPGVGPYTAAALTAFANRKRAIVIDTNVRRVVGRLFFGKPFTTLADDVRFRRLLERITPRTGDPSAFPQALMDFGSAICTANAPTCGVCPLKATCRAAPRFLSAKPLPRHASTANETRHRDKKYPDRIYRGRILAEIRTHGSSTLGRLGPLVDETYHARSDRAWVRAMVGRLAKDGLLVLHANDIVSLPYS